MTVLQLFKQKFLSLGISITASGDTWVTTPIGVFTHPSEDRILFSPNSMLDSPSLAVWITLTTVEVFKEIDDKIKVFPASECFPLNAEYTEFEMDPEKVASMTLRAKSAKILKSAQDMLTKDPTEPAETPVGPL